MAKKPRIKACSNCGSANLEWIGGGANAVFDFSGASGLSGLLHCPDCGRDILPIEFPSEQARKKFAASIKKSGEKISSGKTGATPLPEQPPGKGQGINLAAGFLSTRLILLAILSVFFSAVFLLIVISQRSSSGLMCAAGLCGVAVVLILLTAASYLSARKGK